MHQNCLQNPSQIHGKSMPPALLKKVPQKDIKNHILKLFFKWKTFKSIGRATKIKVPRFIDPEHKYLQKWAQNHPKNLLKLYPGPLEKETQKNNAKKHKKNRKWSKMVPLRVPGGGSTKSLFGPFSVPRVPRVSPEPPRPPKSVFLWFWVHFGSIFCHFGSILGPFCIDFWSFFVKFLGFGFLGLWACGFSGFWVTHLPISPSAHQSINFLSQARWRGWPAGQLDNI